MAVLAIRDIAERRFGNAYAVVAGMVERRGYEVVTDWAGDAAISEADAADLVEWHERSSAEHQQLQREWRQYTAQRIDARMAARQEAGSKAQKEWQQKEAQSMGNDPGYAHVGYTGLFRLPVSGAARTAGRAAAQEAAKKWDKKNGPELGFNEWVAKNKKGKR